MGAAVYARTAAPGRCATWKPHARTVPTFAPALFKTGGSASRRELTLFACIQ